MSFEPNTELGMDSKYKCIKLTAARGNKAALSRIKGQL